MLDFKIGFLPISLFDVLDVLIVAYLIYQLYKLLRGSIAFNIFIGLLFIFVMSWLVRQLGMELLTGILGTFVDVGVIILIIIFQPEVRRFLLLIGNRTLESRGSFLDRWLDRESADETTNKDYLVDNVLRALQRMSRHRTGALLVFMGDNNLEGIVSGGTELDAYVSEGLLLSIFNKESPLHDGAVIISHRRVVAAGSILPVSENQQLPKRVGLRHRAAVGVTERAGVAAFVVSEETGSISCAYDGNLEHKLSQDRLRTLLYQHL
jgi:diadenylate cyclase